MFNPPCIRIASATSLVACLYFMRAILFLDATTPASGVAEDMQFTCFQTLLEFVYSLGRNELLPLGRWSAIRHPNLIHSLSLLVCSSFISPI